MGSVALCHFCSFSAQAVKFLFFFSFTSAKFSLFFGSLSPTFGGNDPGLRAELVHSVKDKLNLIYGCSYSTYPTAFASASVSFSVTFAFSLFFPCTFLFTFLFSALSLVLLNGS